MRRKIFLPTTFDPLPAVCVLLVFCTAVSGFSFVTADPDLWGHLKFGAASWDAGGPVRTDPYSYTAQGHEWINHEWLSEILFSLTYRFFGDTGLLLVKLAIGLGTVAFVVRTCTDRTWHPLVLAGVGVLAVWVMQKGFMTRPQIFSFLFFAGFWFVLHRYFLARNRLFLLPPAMVVWVNLHGGFLMGVALVTGVAGWRTLEKVGFDSRRPTRWLWITAGVCLSATLVNPYGFRLLSFLYHSLSQTRQITEWTPVSLWDATEIHLKVMAALLCFTLAAGRRRALTWEAAAAAALMAAAFRHQRHMPFFAIAAAPFLVFHLSGFVHKAVERFPQLKLGKSARHLVVAAVALLAAWHFTVGSAPYRHSGFRIVVDPSHYPVGAVRFLHDNRVSGDILLPFDWGEYVIWWLYPGCHVSIDGRFRTVYPESVLKDHLIHRDDAEGWLRLMAKYPADILLLETSDKVALRIHDETDWVHVYADKTAMVFCRRNENNRAFLERMRNGSVIRDGSALPVFFP